MTADFKEKFDYWKYILTILKYAITLLLGASGACLFQSCDFSVDNSSTSESKSELKPNITIVVTNGTDSVYVPAFDPSYNE